MYLIGQILNLMAEESSKMQELHALIHVVDGPKIDENEDNEVVKFIYKDITWALHDKAKYLTK